MFTPTLRCECAQPGLIDTIRKWSIECTLTSMWTWKLYQLYLVFIFSPERISERDYVITHSVRSVVCSMYVVCGILQN